MCGGGLGGLLGGVLGVATGGFGLGLGALAGGAVGGGVGGAITGGGFKGVLPGAMTGAGVGAGAEALGWGGTPAGMPMGVNTAGAGPGYVGGEFGGTAGAPISASSFNIPGTGSDTFTGASPSNQIWQGLSTIGQNLGGMFTNATGMGGAGTGAGGGGFSSMLNLGTGLYGLQQAENLRKLAAQNAARIDPMAAYRADYAARLQDLQANPNQITSMPGYQSGLQAVQRSQAAQGYQGSGNMMAALSGFGGNFYQQQFQNLSNLAGANNTWAPGTAGQLAYSGGNEAAAASMQNLNRLGLGLNTMGY